MPRLRFPDLGSRVVTQGKSDKPPGIFGPALQDGKIEQRELVALDDFFAGSGRHRAREKLSGFRQQRKHLELVEKTLGRFHIHEHADAAGDFVEGIDAERELHAGVGTELIDEELRTGMAFEVLEEQCGAAASTFGIATLGDAVSDFSNLKDRVGFGLNALELTGAVERCDPLAEVVEGQRFPLCDDRRL